MKIFIGYDPRDHDAYRVAEQSIRENTKADVDIIPLKDWELRKKGIYWRPYRVEESGQMWDERDGKPFSTQFSFTRFAVPLLEDYGNEWVLFIDADMMFRADIEDLFALADDKYAVMCVKHNQKPTELMKMDGVLQTKYARKNWSSVMLMKPSKCRGLTPYALNNWDGSSLHGLHFIEGDDLIGELPATWNFLAGYDDPSKNPKNVHFTLGTPDMQLFNAPPTPWDGEWWDCLDRAKKGVFDAPKTSIRD
jgi:lipopolysaccharide biosynthesis glycosyltransferase